MSGIFISYRREDTKAYARLLSDAVAEHFGHRQVFRDIDTMGPGVDFRAAITDGVGKCDVLLALIGDRWLSATKDGHRRLDDPDDYVGVEIAAALRRNVLVIPILIEDARMPARADLPEAIAELADRNAHRLADEGWNDAVQRLVDALAEVVNPMPPPSSSGARAATIVGDVNGDVSGQVAIGQDIRQTK